MIEPEAPVSERFAVRRRLGEGGFGVVYEAWDSKLEAPVAVKLLRRVENTALLRFKSEFRSLADVLHPNLVRLGELVSTGSTWFFTMELIDGSDILSFIELPDAGRDHEAILDSPTVGPESLTIDTPASGPPPAGLETSEAAAVGLRTEQLPPRANPFDEARLRDAFGQLAEGVSALHGFGLLHRDLKPSNVLVARDGRVVVLDFGLVAHLGEEDLTESVHIVGTPAYMSPEQGMGREVGPASDWYSVGVMLYEALTGSPLFRGSLPQILRDRQSPVPRPRDLVPGVPEDLDALCRDLLQIDPAARPSGPEVAARLQRPLKALAAEPAAPVRDDRFVGRELELGVLADALDRVRDGRAATVFVSGASGMGKTALVRCFLDRLRAADSDALVLNGRCYQRENVPYKALDSLVDELSRRLGRMKALEAAQYMPRDRHALARLFPVLGGIGETGPGRRREPEIPDAIELRRRAFAALRELLGRLADNTTVVLFIDDLQWGDVDSAALLREITRPPDPPPMLLLVCFRKEEAERSPLLKVLAQDNEQQSSSFHVELAELAEDEARELALAVIGDHGAAAVARAEQIARESGGSPFFVDELARHQVADGDDRPEALRLDSVLETRFARLPEEARRLLEVVAVAGEPLDLEAANRAAELVAKEQNAIELLRAGQWVRPCAIEGREAFETFHDRIRETIVALVPDEQLPSRHLRLAEAWESHGTASSATLVEHYLVGGDRCRAADHARRAADEAASELAFDRAARLYEIGLDAGEWEPEERRDLLARLAEALANAGRGEDAARAFLEAAKGGEPGAQLELRRRAAEQFLISGHIDEGRGVLQSVLEMVGMRLPATPQRALAALLLRRLQMAARGIRFAARAAGDVDPGQLTRIDVCWSVAVGFGMVDNIRGAHFQSLNLLRALQAGEPFRVARALTMELAFSAVAGVRSRRRTAALVEQCRVMVQDLADPHLSGFFTLQEGVVANLEGRFADSLECSELAETILREQCTGVPWELDTAQLYRNHSLIMMGRWKELAARVPAMLEDARDRADLYLATYLRTRNAFILHLAADDVERAQAEQASSLDGWSQQGFQVQHYWNWYASGEVALYGGTPEAAWERIERGWPAFKRSLLTRAQAVFVEAVFLRARVALAAAARASGAEAGRFLERAARDAKVLEREAMPSGEAAAALIRAAIGLQRGDRAAALDRLRAAVEGFARIELPHYGAAARWRLGHLLGTAEGEAMLDDARAWFGSQGVENPERMAGMLAPGRWT